MPRVVKEHAHASKRNEILDATVRLVYVKGFDQVSIQDLLNDLKISKGAFYHYFGSKADLLEATLERMFEPVLGMVEALVQDQSTPPLPKLQRYFSTLGQWKSERKEVLFGVMRVWYSDDNAVLRLKFGQRNLKYANKWLAEIIRQGVAQGVFQTRYPDQVGGMAVTLIQGLGDRMAEMLLSPGQGRGAADEARGMVAALNDAIEQLLGAPAGSIATMSPALIDFWFGDAPAPPGDQPA